MVLSACGSPKAAPAQQVSRNALASSPTITFEDLQRRREAYDMTQAYRAKLGLPHSSLKSGSPVVKDRVTALLMKKRHPEFGLDHIYVQGLDDPVARPTTSPAPKGKN